MENKSKILDKLMQKSKPVAS